MSYYRYITGVYKSYWPGLNRTLRSTSVPRTIPGCLTTATSLGFTNPTGLVSTGLSGLPQFHGPFQDVLLPLHHWGLQILLAWSQQDSPVYLSSTDHSRMSYYRYITGVYKSYWPGLNRTLRSTSVPRT